MSNPALVILEQQRQLVANLRAQLAQAETQLDGMEMIIQAMPSRRRASTNPRAGASVGSAGNGGRQPGAISMRWRQILGGFYAQGKPFSPQDVADAVQRLEDRQMKPSEARRILDGYVTYEYVTVDQFGLFTVTDLAAQKFDFARADPVVPAVSQLSEGASTTPAVITPAQAFAAAPAVPLAPPPGWGAPTPSTWVPPAPTSAAVILPAPPMPHTHIGHLSPSDNEGQS